MTERLANDPFRFHDATATVSVNENTPSGTNIAGAGRTSADADRDTLTYTFVTTGDYDHFSLTSAGQVRTKDPLDYESETSYTVTVQAADPDGATARITYTINVQDLAEPPDAPATPGVEALPVEDPLDPQYRLRISWNAPANAGRLAISGYDLQYRQGTSGSWTNGPQDVTTTSATITGLAEDTPYQIQVRATNDAGDSGWSAPPGSGRTNVRGNSAPVFTRANEVFEIAENTPASRDVSSPVHPCFRKHLAQLPFHAAVAAQRAVHPLPTLEHPAPPVTDVFGGLVVLDL